MKNFYLDNWQTIFIDSNSEVYYLTPFEKISDDNPWEVKARGRVSFNNTYDFEGQPFTNAPLILTFIEYIESHIVTLRENLDKEIKSLQEDLEIDTDYSLEDINKLQEDCLKIKDINFTQEMNLISAHLNNLNIYEGRREDHEETVKRIIGLKNIIYQKTNTIEKNRSNIFAYDHSLSERKGEIKYNDSIYAEIGQCFIVICRSTVNNRYWLLHYDPIQTLYNDNLTAVGEKYYRPNYCDLNPKIPYKNKDANLREDEKIDVLVIAPNKTLISNNSIYNKAPSDYFSKEEFLNRFKNNVNSIQYIEKDSGIDVGTRLRVEFSPKNDHLDLFLCKEGLALKEAQRITIENCFKGDNPNKTYLYQANTYDLVEKNDLPPLLTRKKTVSAFFAPNKSLFGSSTSPSSIKSEERYTPPSSSKS